MQRLLVTGGCGYLGRELVRRAPARGWDVRATWFERRPQVPGGAEWVQADIRDPEAARRAVTGVDAVIHTAYRQGEWDVNVTGSASVAEAARALRLVHLSTDLVFDGRRGRYREEDPPAPVSPYGRSKAEAERLVRELHDSATIARTSLIYGGDEPGAQERLAAEGRQFFVDEIRSPVQVGDLAEALLEVARIEPGHTTPDRAPDVSLDSARAAALLQTRLRGVYEVLSGD